MASPFLQSQRRVGALGGTCVCVVFMSLGLVCAWKAPIVVYVRAVQGWREWVACSFAEVGLLCVLACVVRSGGVYVSGGFVCVC